MVTHDVLKVFQIALAHGSCNFENFQNITLRLPKVQPVLSGPVLNGHPLLSGQLQKSRKFLLLTTLNVTSIKRSPPLSGRGHHLQSPSKGISIVFIILVIKSSYFF